MGKQGKQISPNRKVTIREGYQGRPLPAGVKVVPPKGPAADVPTNKSSK